MRLYLAGIEWITQPPEGNRLRWWYPVDDTSGGGYLGLPEAVVVERAPLDEDLPQLEKGKSFSATGTIPFNWWDHVGTVHLAGIDLPSVHQLSPSVQAVRFVYRGPSTRLLIRDTSRDLVLLDKVVTDGEHIFFEAADIDEIVVFSHAARLENLETADMFKPRGLAWEQIAIVGVAPTMGAGLDEVLPRHGGTSSLSPTEWGELVQMAQEATASTPGAAVEGEPTKWESLSLTLALRWELAALFGFGYFDGPHADVSPLDEIDTGIELGGVDSVSYAYRVLDRSGTVDHSNIVVCPQWPAPPLAPPSPPVYLDPQVHMNIDEEFEATVEMQWTHHDPRAIGVMIEETVSASPTIGGSATTEVFEHRSRFEDDPAGIGRLARVFDVAFHDVTLTSIAQATDAWDRLSPASAPSATTSLVLYHQPPAPGLRPGTYNSGNVRLPRQLGDENLADWEPDRIVKEAAGRVRVYRQIAQPRVVNGTAQLPALVSGDRHRVGITGISAMSDFDGGYLNARGVKYVVAGVSGNDVFFDAPGAGNSGVTLFPAGPVTLQQDDKDPALWTQVADFPAVGLPDELTFTDTVPGPTGGTDVLSYSTRVAYLGRLGPPGNVAQVIRIAETPPVPPPFTVDLLGVDFYDRTLVKIRLTNPASGQFTVWWADGSRSASQFADHATPGIHGAQSAHSGRYLFDVLSVPIPQTQSRTITVGVQAVSPGGIQSNFSVVPVVIPV